MAAKPKTQLDDRQALLIAKALADPRRYEILKHLGEYRDAASPCSAIRECMEFNPATLSHHMKELEMAGLVRPVREGKFVSYLLNREVLRLYLERLRTDLG